MPESPVLLESLRQSSKGQLRYDRDWHRIQGVKSMLEECTSPPLLTSIRSPHGGIAQLGTPKLGSPKRGSPSGSLPSQAGAHKPGSPKRGSPPGALPQDAASLECSSRGKSPLPILSNLSLISSASKKGHCPSSQTDQASVNRSPRQPLLSQSEESMGKSGSLSEKLGKSGPLSEKSNSSEMVSPKAYQSDLAIIEFEEESKNRVEAAIKLKREEMEREQRLIQRKAENNLLDLHSKQDTENKKKLEQILMATNARTQELQQRQQVLKEHHKRHAKLLHTKMQEAEVKKQQLEEEEKKRQEKMKICLAVLVQTVDKVKATKQKVEQLFNSCNYKRFLPANVPKSVELMSQICQRIENIVQQARQNGATDDHLNVANEYLCQASNILDLVMTTTDEATKKGQEPQLAELAGVPTAVPLAVTTAATPASAATTTTSATVATATATSTTTTTQDATTPVTAVGETLCAPVKAYEFYLKLQENQKNIENSYQAITGSDPRLKKYKFDLQKAVNLPVNAISKVSGAHLRDKLEKLCSLLAGQLVEVSNKKIRASEHPAGVEFCKDLLAKKIIKQGDEQVSSNFESAFPIAMVTVGVWCMYPDFGNLLLAHFHQACPYLVPYYKPKEDGQSRNDYYVSLGYEVVDGQCEKQDKFLRRMTGYMRLFAAITVSPPPRGDKQAHPWGVEKGWEWLCNILNLEPRPDITATLLMNFLVVAGSALAETYGKQFFKLLHLLCTEYLPKVKQVTLPGSGGPVTRLEQFLQNCIRNGKIEPPEGKLSAGFWFS